ncbi:unnamed protein product [Moneuplotes crassus]|uniref:Uncharacterized protein n=1 Tax=Euplotes crassus TaxID=5936 RepID=A0AAD1XIQ0_EUPCR|nr:unnamed protein product [Moneuplotes crassus]
MESVANTKQIEKLIYTEKEVYQQEQMLHKAIYHSIRNNKIIRKNGFLNISPNQFAIKLEKRKYIYSDFSKIALPEDYNLNLTINCEGSKFKLYEEILINIGRNRSCRLVLECREAINKGINYSFIRKCLRHFNDDMIVLKIIGKRISGKIFPRLIQKCCKFKKLEFMNCVFINIQESCFIGANAQVKDLTFNYCTSVGGEGFAASESVEHLVKLISTTSLKKCIKSIRFENLTEKNRVMACRETYGLHQVKILMFDYDSLDFVELH